MGVLTDLKPKKVFEYFEWLSSVPHGSGNTKEISDLCVSFAKDHGLEYYQDDLNNVIIYKGGSKGFEEKEPVIIQGHLDMVCVKNDGCPIDMAKEPIQLETDGKMVWAKGTSLGADNISAIAMALAILDDDSIEHPPLECVFTVDEETGMWGAKGLDYSKLSGKRMMNIDSDEEGVFTIGCAGGLRTKSVLPVSRDKINEKMTENTVFVRVYAEGFTGGHSGNDIDKERANANIFLSRLLYNVSGRVGIRLCDISGGKVDNAIPRSCTAKVAVPRAAYKVFSEEIRKNTIVMKKEYESSDPGITVSVLGCKCDEAPVSREDTVKILSLLMSIPNGIQNMCAEIKYLPETSLNLGILRLEDNCLVFENALRSSVPSRKELLAEKIKVIVGAFGGTVTSGSGYPCWTIKKYSEFRDILVEAYDKTIGGKPEIVATHAGLECGIFMENIPDLDCVSFAPNLFDLHSPQERLEVASAERVFNMVKEALKMM